MGRRLIQSLRVFWGVEFCIGVYYFLIYCINENVPLGALFSSYSWITGFLVFIGLVFFFLSAFLIFYFAIPVVIHIDPPKKYYELFFVGERGHVYSILGFFMYFVIPAAYYFVIYVRYKFGLLDWWGINHYYAPLLILVVPSLVFVVWAIKYRGVLSRSEVYGGRHSLFLVAQAWVPFFLIGLTIPISLLIFLYVLKSMSGSESISGPGIFVVFALFCAVQYFILMPSRKSDEFKRIAVLSGSVSWRGQVRQVVFSPWFSIIAIFYISFLLNPASSYRVAKYSFRFLGIGDVYRKYYFLRSSEFNLPSSVVESCSKSVCLTRNVKVILDVGNILYVYDEDNNVLLGLPRKGLYLYKKIDEYKERDGFQNPFSVARG